MQFITGKSDASGFDKIQKLNILFLLIIRLLVLAYQLGLMVQDQQLQM